MKLNEEQIKEAKQLYLQKVSLKELSKRFNVCQTTISKALKSVGCIPTKKGYSNACRFSREKEQDIIDRYKRGETQKDIANIYNTFNTSIRRVLLRYNILPRGNTKVQRFCKHNPFKRGDEISDYFLGLLVTDGCIPNTTAKRCPTINLSLSEVDKYMVEFYRDWGTPRKKVTKIFQKINSSYMYSCEITNQEALDWITRKANFHNKSYEARLYTKINWNILRGIFDGDGGFRTANNDGLNFFICGLSKSFLTQVYNFLIKEGFDAYFKYVEPDKWHKNGLYYVYVYKYEDVLKLGIKMYSNAHIFLNRKYMKWLTFYENKRNKYDLNSGKAGIANPEQNLPTPHEVKYKEGRDVQRL